MKNRTIKNRFKRLDELSLPAKEKMLPAEALTDKTAYVAKERKAFPKLAVASLAIVALAVATGLVIGSVAGGNEKQLYPNNNLVLNNDIENTSTPSILENEASDNGASAEHTSTEESEVSRKDMPIVSCGKYGGSDSSCTPNVYPGKVIMARMDGSNSNIDINKLQDDVLYAVCFTADYMYSQAYKELIIRLNGEKQEKTNAEAEKIIDYLKQNEKEEYKDFSNDYQSRIEVYPSEDNYDDFCNFVLLYMYFDYKGVGIYKYAGMENLPEWFVPIDSELKQIMEEYEEKVRDFELIMGETTTTNMYEYLDSLGIKFYDKTMYVLDTETEPGKILVEEVYRVAFLTKEQIKSLKGGEDYGILIEIVFKELAKMDNEPVYVKSGLWSIDA